MDSIEILGETGLTSGTAKEICHCEENSTGISGSAASTHTICRNRMKAKVERKTNYDMFKTSSKARIRQREMMVVSRKFAGVRSVQPELVAVLPPPAPALVLVYSRTF